MKDSPLFGVRLSAKVGELIGLWFSQIFNRLGKLGRANSYALDPPHLPPDSGTNLRKPSNGRGLSESAQDHNETFKPSLRPSPLRSSASDTAVVRFGFLSSWHCPVPAAACHSQKREPRIL